MRATAIVLILLNLVLGAGLLESIRNDATRAQGFRSCCRVAGAEAYCCDQCCWFRTDCDFDSDCQDA